MKFSRREFLAASAASAVALNGPVFAVQERSDSAVAWHKKMRRCAQHNLNEYDPRVLDIDAWVDYWTDIKLDTLILTGGGFIAMYPTKLANHHRSQFLGNRDLFGDYLKACKSKGIRVVARVETNWLHEEVFKSRPEWIERDADGSPRHHVETPWVYRTCLFSNYRTEQIPAIMREMMSLYDVDGFFTNSWPRVGRPYLCHCVNCQREGQLTGPALYERYIARTLETCRLLNTVVKEKRPDCVYNINIGGGIRAVQNLKQIGALAEWMTTDHQERGGNTPIWDCAQQGRVAYAVMKGRPVTNVVGSKSGPWRHSTKSPAETTLWLAQTTASGMVPWYVWLGSELPDRRWRETGRAFYQWLARHEAHFFNRRPMASLGVVFSQRANGLYNAPGPVRGGYGAVAGGRGEAGNPTEYLQGLYYALLEGRFVFDLVHEEDLSLDVLKKYTALALPNVALLSDEQCRTLRQYVRSGGSLLATFETSLYNEWGKRREDLGLADLFEAHLAPGYQGPVGRIFYASIDRKHAIVEGFGDTDRLPGGEYRVPVKVSDDPVLTVVPPYPRGIPEMVYAHPRAELDYPRQRSTEPAVVIRENGSSRVVYFPTDIDRNTWRRGNKDLSMLLQNSIRWILRDQSPVTVEGEGWIEIFAWETEPGYAVHILNYNNPNMTRAEIRRNYAIGPQKVRIRIAEGAKIARAELLRAETKIDFKQTGRTVEFVIPSIEDFEVAVLYSAS